MAIKTYYIRIAVYNWVHNFYRTVRVLHSVLSWFMGLTKYVILCMRSLTWFTLNSWLEETCSNIPTHFWANIFRNTIRVDSTVQFANNVAMSAKCQFKSFWMIWRWENDERMMRISLFNKRNTLTTISSLRRYCADCEFVYIVPLRLLFTFGKITHYTRTLTHKSWT